MTSQGVHADWSFASEFSGGLSHKVYSGPIDKSDFDNRDYRILVLQNGIKVVLVHDAAADKAAACVHVAVGHLQDPFEVPGLAHFCEHMITKGSDPFPTEDAFASFIAANGGSKNAGTSAEIQDYWFSINLPQLPTAVAMLAAFFHSPHFTPSLTSREMYAVDSENKRNLQKDTRRIHQLAKSLSVPGHPWTKFGTGNVESLTEAARKKLDAEGVQYDLGHTPDGDGGPIGREVRRRLSEWWEKQYCASRMGLAVLSNDSLDDLEKLVIPLFSPILNRGVLETRPTTTEPAWGSEQRGSIVFVKTVKDYHELKLVFHTLDQIPLFKTRPVTYIIHFLGHEGEGSVCAYLRKKGYLIDLAASMSTLKSRSIHTIEVSGTLTREGYLHYKEVILAIYSYLSLLRESTFEAYHFSEIAKMSEVHFRFQEKSQPSEEVRELSHRLLLDMYPPRYLLSLGAANREWDETAVRQVLDMMRPELGRAMLLAKDHDSSIVGEDACWEQERWYGTEYIVKRLDEELIQKGNEANQNAELSLPPPNQYIPKNLAVPKRDVPEPLQAPLLLRQSALSTIWHKQDDRFWVPKAKIRLHILSPIAYTTPRHAVLSRLLADLLEDELSEVTYNAELAGLSYSVSNTRTGLLVAFGGYNDKLSLLVDTVIQALTTLTIRASRLKVMIEKLSRAYKNYYMGQPSDLVMNFTSDLLSPVVWSAEEKLAELEDMTEDEVTLHRQQLLSRIHLQTLFTGNIDSETSLGIVEKVEAALGSRALKPAGRPVERSLILPAGANYVVQKQHADPKEKNSAISYYCHFGDIANSHLRAVLRLLVHITREPTFRQLRTVEQLGYVVTTPLWTSVGSMGIGFKVQSLKHPSYLEERINAFLVSHRQKLGEFTEDDLKTQKDGLVLKLTEAPKNSSEETSQFWGHITQGYNDFGRNHTDAELVKNIALEELLRVYDSLLLPNSGERRKLSVYLLSQQVDTASVVTLDGVTVVEDETLFKRSLSCSAAAVPLNSGEMSQVHPSYTTQAPRLRL